MIKLFHCQDARSFRALWMLEEMRLPYELVCLPFPPRALAPDYLRENPLGTVPLLVDGKTRMTESIAIAHYLAAKHGPTSLEVTRDEPGFGAYLNWLVFGEATLTFPQTIVLRYRTLEPGRAETAADDYARWYAARLRAVEAALAHTDYLCGGRFTAADISVCYALYLSEFTGLDQRMGERTRAYWASARERDGFKRAQQAQATSPA